MNNNNLVLMVKAAPSGPDKRTTSQNWVNVPHLNSSITVNSTSNLSITVSGEVGGKRVFLRALVDGRTAIPSDVLFTAKSFRGIRSFTFIKENLEIGSHSVQIQWLENDDNGIASIGDRTLSLCASPESTDYGGLSIKSAPSGPNVETNSNNWVDVPDLSKNIVTTTTCDLSITVAGEAGGKRMFLRALVDGQPASPSDVLFATESFTGTRSFTFIKENLVAGNHAVQIQWHEDSNDTASFGDRTLTLFASPNRTETGGLTVRAAASGQNVTTNSRNWVDVPGLSNRITATVPCSLSITVSGEAGGGRMFLRALVDGQPTNPSDVLFTAESFKGIRSFTFTKNHLRAGEHSVQIQWHEDSNGTASFGDRTLTLNYSSCQPDLVKPFDRLQPTSGKRKVVVILWDPQRPDNPAPSRAAIENAFIGNSNSVKQFFSEASLGRFDFEIVDFLPPSGSGNLDWYPANRPAAHYWGPKDPNDQDGDGFTSGHTEKWAEAVWKASNDFNFSAYDHNNNGILDPNDLLVCMMIPQNRQEGYQRTPAGQQFPNWKPLKSEGVNSGVEIPTILEIYIGNPPSAGLMFHEFAHLLIDAIDMYHGWPPESEYVPFTIGPFSLMATGMPANLDPFHRLKYGWLRHRFASRSGRYSLRAAVTHGEALVLMDVNHSLGEYFILENRWDANNTCDGNLPDQGIAVWHIIEDKSIYNASPTPNGTDPTYWASTANQWSRRGVRMIRPVVNPPITYNNKALWDGSQPETGYDLLSNDPNPQHSELRWAGGSPSGFAVRNISPSGNTVEFDLDVPW